MILPNHSYFEVNKGMIIKQIIANKQYLFIMNFSFIKVILRIFKKGFRLINISKYENLPKTPKQRDQRVDSNSLEYKQNHS